MKKNPLLLFSLVAMCTTITGCNGANKKSNHKIWYAYSTENLISDWDYFSDEPENDIYKQRDKTLRFSCMKNENEGVQLMITANKYIDSFDFELPDVTGPSGTISKDNFSVAAAYYMNVDYSNEKNSMGGLYPDALVPLSNYKFRRMNYINKDRNQSLYINLRTQKDTSAGEYKGTGKLHLDREIIDIPFEVKVYDAVMPDTCHQQSAFGIWFNETINGEKENAGPEMDMKYFNFLVDKRLSPRDLPDHLVLDKEDFTDYIQNYIDIVVKNEKNSNGRLPFTSYDISKERVKKLFQKMIDKNIELRLAGDTEIDLFKKAYFYIDDEPFAAMFDDVRNHDKMIFDAKKEMCDQLLAYPDLYESFTHIPNIVTREFLPELVATNTKGGIECWCPLVNYFQTPEQRANYRERKKSNDRDFGEHVWWYNCCDPISPYPNYHLDSDLMYSRVLRYMQYDYGVEGQIFWCVNYYSKYVKNQTVSRDIWNDPISWANCAGDGQLVYPGYNFGIKGPITTLRLESVLAGNEEYEYLWMIDQKVQEYNASKGKSFVTNDLLYKYYSKLFTNVIAETDKNNFENVRLELLDLVESLYKDLDSGMGKLL